MNVNLERVRPEGGASKHNIAETHAPTLSDSDDSERIQEEYFSTLEFWTPADRVVMKKVRLYANDTSEHN